MSDKSKPHPDTFNKIIALIFALTSFRTKSVFCWSLQEVIPAVNTFDVLNATKVVMAESSIEVIEKILN